MDWNPLSGTPQLCCFFHLQHPKCSTQKAVVETRVLAGGRLISRCGWTIFPRDPERRRVGELFFSSSDFRPRKWGSFHCSPIRRLLIAPRIENPRSIKNLLSISMIQPESRSAVLSLLFPSTKPLFGGSPPPVFAPPNDPKGAASPRCALARWSSATPSPRASACPRASAPWRSPEAQRTAELRSERASGWVGWVGLSSLGGLDI